MKKVKLRIIPILALFTVMAVLIGFAIGTLGVKQKASAAAYETTSIFSQGTGGDVKAYKESDEDDATTYTAFVISDGGSVYYRRNLALKWYEGVPTEEEDEGEEGADAETSSVQTYSEDPANPAVVCYYGLTFRFTEINFETFTIRFESAEENITKAGKTANSVVFSYQDNTLQVAVRDADHQKKDSDNEDDEEAILAGLNWITITNPTQWLTLTLSETTNGAQACDIGEFAVYLKGDSLGTQYLGKFVNVGGNYLEYRSSASATPNTPMTFTADLSDETKTQKVLLSELNGQSLAVTGGTAVTEEDEDGTTAVKVESDGTVEMKSGAITDNKPAALVLNEEVYGFRIGQKFSLTYVAIDVCDDSVNVTRQYYIYGKNIKEEDGEESVEEYPEGSPEDDAYSSLSTSTYFMPKEDLESEEIYVSIRLLLNDGTYNTSSTGANKTYVYLTWYATDSAVKTLNGFDYIVVNRVSDGPYYKGLTADEDKQENVVDSSVFDEAVENYQDAVNAAAEELSAGSGAYFYLPSLRGLIASDYADYRNLKFSIFYFNQSHGEDSSASSATTLAYNALRFEIPKEGRYLFRVLAVDAAGNGMMYYSEDGTLVTVSSSNIWDIEEIPEFSFEVHYTGAVIENSGEQTLGYRDTSYSITDFQIIATDGIEKEYSLYYFNLEKYLEENDTEPLYSDLVANISKYFDEYVEKGWLELINVYDNDITLDDDKWDESSNPYYWTPDTSLSFLPVKSGFYVVELLLTDVGYFTPKLAYQVIEIQNPFDYTPGVSKWLQNNVTSVVLFSISAVLLVVIIILFVVKPSDKKVEDVDLEKLKGKRKSK